MNTQWIYYFYFFCGYHISANLFYEGEGPCNMVTNMLGCDIIVSLNFNPIIGSTFNLLALRKGINPLIPIIYKLNRTTTFLLQG